MAQDMQDEELIQSLEKANSVPTGLLNKLLELAPAYENLNIHGAKAELSRRVGAILDGASGTAGHGAKP